MIFVPPVVPMLGSHAHDDDNYQGGFGRVPASPRQAQESQRWVQPPTCASEHKTSNVRMWQPEPAKGYAPIFTPLEWGIVATIAAAFVTFVAGTIYLSMLP